MEIHFLDWILYFIITAVIGAIGEDTEATIESFVVWSVFTMIWCIVFYFYDVVDIFEWMKHSVKIKP